MFADTRVPKWLRYIVQDFFQQPVFPLKAFHFKDSSVVLHPKLRLLCLSLAFASCIVLLRLRRHQFLGSNEQHCLTNRTKAANLFLCGGAGRRDAVLRHE